MNTVQSQLPIKLIKMLLVPVFLIIITGGCEYIIPNKPPFAEKISPADSLVFHAGQVVNIKVNAYDVDGSVVEVVFTAPNAPAFSDETAPYEFAWATAGLTGGNYQVQIKAVDNKDEPYIISATIRLLGGMTAYAGRDTSFTDSRTSFVLDANVPAYSQGTWTIISGSGGEISDIHNPKALLTGTPCQTYTLRWTVSDGVNQVSDEVSIGFFYQPGQANAGGNQLISDGRTTTSLQAIAPVDGTGRWRISSGNTGSFNNAALPNATFTGQACNTYILIWTVSTPCAATSDTVEIRFDQYLENPNAGPDQAYSDGRTTAILAANRPIAGSGTWTVVSGQNGQFSNVNDPTAVFTGQMCQSYMLRWTLATPCSSKSDDVMVSFTDLPSPSNAGADLNLTDGTIYAQLNAVSPTNGTGLWSIMSGGDGSFSNAGDPKAIFSGLLCHSYVLRWTISTACAAAFDEVTVILNQVELNSNAGPDVRISGGSLHTFLQGNNPRIGMTGTWSILSGQGGTIEEVNSPGSGFTGLAGQIYVLKWSLSGACIENADVVTIAFISNTEMLDARDGRTYQSVKIGNQEWMAENLNYLTPGSFYYDNNGDNALKYGMLYGWSTAGTACPSGWHLPTDLEWRQLETFLGMDGTTSLLEWYRGLNEGGMLKEEGIANWASPNAGATNITGFTARPGGYRTPGGVYGGVTTHAGFWTATENTDGKAIYRTLHKDRSQVGRDWYDKGYGFSVRCVKN